jgi:uncharacterized protein (TIGR00251 family)
MSCTLDIHVQPRAKRDEIAGWHGERLRIRLTAPPVDGAANEALIRFLAKALGLRRSQISLTLGERSRDKTLRIEGIEAEDLHRRLGRVSR